MAPASQLLVWRSCWPSLSSHHPLRLFCHRRQCKNTGTLNDFPNVSRPPNCNELLLLMRCLKTFISRLDGTVQPVWHQRIELDIDGKHEDLVGLDLVAGDLHQLVERVKEHGASKVVLGGFSMGAHTALHAVYRGGVRVDACLALSSYLVRSSAVYKHLEKQKSSKPLLMCHGLSDVIVPPSWAEETGLALKKQGVDLNLKFYQGLGHHPGAKMMADAFYWVEQL